ncbi:MAG: 4-(cytidine 5'-diphospho)-2-C-methyl-D-erythritol kinase [candidate division WOR-3 bacterium]|nr:MAG: 4-(cytidine 5'-diphospho)-2-C-methyl-D-erythritol kinase [candidate division WOR-3 bacterium]
MISMKALAKVNVGLKILDKREDGFHNIETTLANINLSDFLTFEEIDTGLVVETKNLELKQEENLCYQSAELFIRRYGITKGLKIRLTKNIPAGAGLGGGSSDAAAVLKGMGRLFNMHIEDKELMEMGAEIGSDVPFFIKGGAAYAKGRGDDLRFFRLPRMELVLYYPGYPVSTKWAYEEYDKTVLTPQPDVDSISQGKKKKNRKGFELENSFEKVIFKYHPDLLDVKMNLLGAGVFFASLSGSGSCLYAVVDSNTRGKVTKYLDGIGATYFEVQTL